MTCHRADNTAACALKISALANLIMPATEAAEAGSTKYRLFPLIDGTPVKFLHRD